MPTEMPTIVWVSGHGTDHSSGARWKQEGQIEGENPTGTGPCAAGIRVSIPSNTNRHTAVLGGLDCALEVCK